MEKLTGLWEVNLRTLTDQIGEDGANSILSDFSCPWNADVECFLRQKAILFSKQRIATTYLVFTSYKDKPVLVGYYALANKSVVIRGATLNSDWRRRLKRFATYDEVLKQYTVALPLIGQLSKNFSCGYDELISGDELLSIACDKVRSIQSLISGNMVYLECEDAPGLISFYQRNGFYRFANRNLDGGELDAGKTKYLVQMIRYLK